MQKNGSILANYLGIVSIITEVAMKHGISVNLLISGARTKTIAIARHDAVIVLRERSRLSWREIGMVLGYKGVPDRRAYYAKKVIPPHINKGLEI